MSEYTTELASLLKKTGISQKRLAEIAGVEPITVMRWSQGKTVTPPLVLQKLRQIAEVFEQ